MTFDLDTSEKVISSIAGAFAILAGVVAFLRRKRKQESELAANGPQNSNVQNVNVSINGTPASPQESQSADLQDKSIASLKRNANILFVDDDRGFKMFSILRRMGWDHTRQVVDVNSLENPQLLESHIVFVDIQGVGKLMQYADEGLGLALAIKKRHPAKAVVIYSAETHGARFHEALQEADYSLSKTAEPIQFENVIVRLLSK